MSGNVRILMITGKGERRSDYDLWSQPFNGELIAQVLSSFAEVEITEELKVLEDPVLETFDIVINNSMFLEPSEAEVEALLRFVNNGKSFLGLHSATVSFLNSPEYIKMIGGRFVAHDDIKTFTVTTRMTAIEYDGLRHYQHPIGVGVEDFNILDEAYIVEGDFSNIEVIARAEGHPVMWWQPWGKGKSLYLALGHESYSIENPGYQELLIRGILWLCGRLK